MHLLVSVMFHFSKRRNRCVSNTFSSTLEQQHTCSEFRTKYIFTCGVEIFILFLFLVVFLLVPLCAPEGMVPLL